MILFDKGIKMNANNAPIAPGFIFIPVDADIALLPPEYIANRRGATGYFARLCADDTNGWEAISFAEYESASQQKSVTVVTTLAIHSDPIIIHICPASRGAQPKDENHEQTQSSLPRRF